MKLLNLKCPNCNATVQVNSDFETAVCNYCGAEFLVQDENETNEERIIRIKAKMDENAKEKERKYYASDDYKKRLDIEKETTVERIFRKINESDKESRVYRNSPEGKKEFKRSMIILFCCVGAIFLIPIIVSFLPDSGRELYCAIDSKRYHIVVKDGEEIQCPSCSVEMLDELNERYLNLDDSYSTWKNVKDYFVNNNGTCDASKIKEMDNN